MLTQTAGIAGKLSHIEVVPDILRAADSHIAGDNEDDGLVNHADVAAGDSQTDDVLAGDTDSQTIYCIFYCFIFNIEYLTI